MAAAAFPASSTSSSTYLSENGNGGVAGTGESGDSSTAGGKSNDGIGAAATTQLPVSRSKQRRERRKKLKAARAPPPTVPPVLTPSVMEPTVKNNLGIISIRRKDFKPLTHDDYKFLVDKIQERVIFTNVTESISIYKCFLRVFCGSKEKLQSVYNCSKVLPEIVDHPGFVFALPGIKFTDVSHIECRLPEKYYSRRQYPAPRLVKWFLAGCPKQFNQSHVKFVKTMKLKSCTNTKKKVVLILEVSEQVLDFVRSKHYITKLDKMYRVKWHLHTRDTGFNNKWYKKVENVHEYWARKKKVCIASTRKHINPCFDFRYQPDVCLVNII